MELNKKKILEMLVIAVLSAFIAFLQNLLSSYLGNSETITPVENAGLIGAGISAIRNIRYV